DQDRAIAGNRRQMRKEKLHLGPRHDVQRVGAEHRVEWSVRPAATDVELQRGRRVRQCRLVQPRTDAGKVFRTIRTLPGQLRQGGGKVHSVLAGAAADLQHAPAVGEVFAQYLEDRFAV